MKLSVRSLGQGPDLVCLHGLYGAGRNWQSIARQLAESFRVWLPDLRNHGASPQAEEMNYPVMAADLRELVQAEGIGRFALLGHSMGGKVAMQYALDYGEAGNLSHLALIDIGPGAYPAAYHQELLAALATLDPASLGTRAEADQALSGLIPAADVRGFLLSSLARADRGFRWQLNLPVLSREITQLTAALSTAGKPPFTACPVLFVAGSASDYVSQSDLPAIRALFPRAECHWIAGAGHWVHTDKPAELLALLQPFLQA